MLFLWHETPFSPHLCSSTLTYTSGSSISVPGPSDHQSPLVGTPMCVIVLASYTFHSLFMKSPGLAPRPQWPQSPWVLGKPRQNKKPDFIHHRAFAAPWRQTPRVSLTPRGKTATLELES